MSEINGSEGKSMDFLAGLVEIPITFSKVLSNDFFACLEDRERLNELKNLAEVM